MVYVILRVKCLVGSCGLQKLQTWSQGFTNYTLGPKGSLITHLVPMVAIFKLGWS
ncbi:hypothetical protein HanXRQr2_Chr05g0214451 [Helianthus annuus]|uniref:Uncharacterized protein n=1 Tax=Helianthus annuus TaxID=4232 RepID=A0A9K3NMK2_HELAN|nr:hypothetical protein HanXRQr2_Chr05g0214451 [Helianthus annuus]